jgi:hypothetical protein
MKRVHVFIIASAMLLGIQAHSQQGVWKLDLAYKVAMPMGNFKNLVNKPSFNGWQGALMYGVSNQVSVGFESGFQDFYQKYPRQVYHGAGSDISAVITNSIQVIPILLKGKYEFTHSGIVQPFAALGVGGSLAQYSKYYGEFSDAHSAFTFTAQPQVGLHIPIGRMKTAGINVAAAYNYVPYKGLDADGLNHASIQAGVSIPLRQ